MNRQAIGKWIVENKNLVLRAIYNSNTTIRKDEIEDLLQYAYCELLAKATGYNGRAKFSTYAFKIIKQAARRYHWKNKYPVSISIPVADRIIPKICEFRVKNNGRLTEDDYEVLRTEYQFNRSTVEQIENLLDKDVCNEDICELLGMKSRYSISDFEDTINNDMVHKDIQKQLSLLPKPYQKAVCSKFDLEIPDTYMDSTAGSKCQNKYHLANAGISHLRKYYLNKYNNIGELIND